MSPFFHKAYDCNLLAITPDYLIEISGKLIDNTANADYRSYLAKVNHTKIELPSKFLPQKDLLDLHYLHYLEQQ